MQYTMVILFISGDIAHQKHTTKIKTQYYI